MSHTAASLATELGKSSRQINRYKKTVEDTIGRPITRQEGQKHYFLDEYLVLIRALAKGEQLPNVVIPKETVEAELVEPQEVSTLTIKSRSASRKYNLEDSGSTLEVVDISQRVSGIKRNFSLARVEEQRVLDSVSETTANLMKEVYTEMIEGLTYAKAKALQDFRAGVVDEDFLSQEQDKH